MRFLAEFKEEMREKGSGAKKSWNLLSEKQRAPYEKAYKKEFAAYEQKLKDCESSKKSSKTSVASNSQAVERVPLGKPAIADPERPERPVGQWLRFVAHFRKKNKSNR